MRTRLSQTIPGSVNSSRWLAGGAIGLLLLVAAACGSSGATPSPTTSGGGGAVTAGTTGSGSASVKAASVGSLGTVLVNPSGMTLYRYTPDGTNKSVCTGGCASLWPPLTVPTGATTATGGSGIPSSDLGIIMRTDGSHQVTYKGMPLYTYTGDTKAGDATGQGLDGIWFVVKAPSAASTPATQSPSTTAKSSGGYGY